MHLSAAMKGLLDKEWRHSRGYLLITLLIIIYAPVITTMFRLMQGDAAVWQWGQELNYTLHFRTEIMHPETYGGILEWLPFLGSVFLGIIILGEEQSSSLKYLMSTPVSRRQIILSKFIPGAATILIAILINAFFMIVFDWLHPMPFESPDVLNWTMLAGALCLASYTLGLMAATFTSGVLAAGTVVFLLNMLPGMLVGMIENIAVRYFAASQAVSIRIYNIGSYFGLHNYISRNGRDIDHIDHYTNFITITGISSNNGASCPDYILESGILLVLVVLLLTLAVIIFERISLFTGGALFTSNWARKTGLALGSAYLAYILAFARTDSLFTFIIWWCILTGLMFASVDILYRLRRHGWRMFRSRPTN
jgi:ABC-type transport system involved in multi-copper enzyme maturation permease subunit